MNKTVKGDMFIIPNETGLKNEFEPTYWSGLLRERLARLAGIELKDDDEMVQVWIVSEKCNNWSDTFGGFQLVIGNHQWQEDGDGDVRSKRKNAHVVGYFPNYIPKRLLEDKKEGDIVELTCPEYGGIKIELTCKQIGYRYSRFGKFEEVLQRVSK